MIEVPILQIANMGIILYVIATFTPMVITGWWLFDQGLKGNNNLEVITGVVIFFFPFVAAVVYYTYTIRLWGFV